MGLQVLAGWGEVAMMVVFVGWGKCREVLIGSSASYYKEVKSFPLSVMMSARSMTVVVAPNRRKT